MQTKRFFKMNQDSFWGKLLYSFIDKIILGTIAAIIIFAYQAEANKKQESIEASQSVCKIYTSILLKQREDIINTMGQYFLLIERIKGDCKVEPSQRNDLADILHKMRFIVRSISDMTPADGQKSNGRLGEVSENFLASIGEMNILFFTKKEFPGKKEIDSKVEEIMTHYRKFLEKVRDITVATIRKEINSINASSNNRSFLSRSIQ